MTQEASGDRRARRARRFPVRTAIFVVLGLLVVAVGWVGVRAWMAKEDVDAMLPLARELQNAAASQDLDQVDAIASELSARAGAVAGVENDPLWRAAEIVPIAGPNLSAVRIAATEVNALAELVPDLTAAVRLLADSPEGVFIDPAELAATSPTFAHADEVVTTASERLAAIDQEPLLGMVADGVAQVSDAVTQLAPVVSTAADATSVLPAMLGGDGERSILVMIQNNAELRTGGGITGSFAELRVDGGHIDLVRQADSREFTPRTTDIVELPDSVLTLYSDVVGRFAQNMSMPTDLETTAALGTAWWNELTGTSPDTIVSVDPVVLQALLSVTGPVDLPNGQQLTAENLVDVLLVQPYRTLETEQQTELFAAATDAVFDRVAGGGIDPFALMQAMSQPVADGRISIWNADSDENAVFASSLLGGPVARQDAAGTGAFAVYFNDATGAKLSTFLDIDISAAVTQCRSDGFADVAVTVTMGSTAPDDLALLPISVTGGGLYGVGVGDIGTNISVAGPRAASAGAVIVKGEPYPAAVAVDNGHATSAARVNLSPGEVNVLEFHFLVPEEDIDALSLLHTPLLHSADVEVASVVCP